MGTLFWPHEQARQSRDEYADAFVNERKIRPLTTFDYFDLPANPTWTEDPHDSRSWSAYYQSLGWLYAAEYAYKNGDFDDFPTFAKDTFYDYFSTNDDRSNPTHELVWHDGTNAFRLATFSYMYHNYFREGNEAGTGISLSANEKAVFDLALQNSLAEVQYQLSLVDKWEGNNHRFFHAMSLASYASVFGQATGTPFYEPNAAAYLQQGLGIVDEVFESIVDLDAGVTQEQSFRYHRFNIELILSAQKNIVDNAGLSLGRDYEAVLQKMLEFDAITRQPGDTIAPVGDAFFQSISGISAIRQVQAEVPWLPTTEYILTEGASGVRPGDVHDYSDAGYVIFRPVFSWEDARDTRVFIDVSPKVISHGHYDNTSVMLSSYGQYILIDSGGPYSYDWGSNELGLGGPFREKYFATSKAHNVVTVNGESFDVDTQTNAVIDTDDYSFVSAQHSGYAGITITRGTLLIKPGILVVFDTVDNAGSGTEEYTLNWHLSPDAVGVDVAAHNEFQINNVHVDAEFATGGATHYEVRAGVLGDDPQGWVTRDLYHADPAPVIEISQNANDAWFVSAFATSLNAADAIDLAVTKTATGFQAVVVYGTEHGNVTLDGAYNISVVEAGGSTGGGGGGSSSSGIIYGTPLDDNILTGNENDSILAGSGNDTVNAKQGDDYISGYNGNDELRGEIGNDLLRGGSGNDTLLGGSGNDSVYGDDDNDYISGYFGVDYLYGGTGNDLIYTGDDSDWAWGEDGNDTIYGEAGNDSISGGAGNDLIFGDSGNDVIAGNYGADELRGNAGADIFRYSAATDSTDDPANRDRIYDFSRAEGDKISFQGFGIDQFIATAGFSATGNGELRYVQESFSNGQVRTTLYADLNGDGIGDMAVQFSKQLIDFISSDFIL